MELRHLRYFIAVAQELHFARAAERLGIAPPSLTQQIQALEHEVGTRLLHRTKRSVQLTAAGAQFLEGARETIRQAERTLLDGRRAGRGELGRLVIGHVISASFSGILAPAIRDYHRLRPAVDIELRRLETPPQLEGLVDGSLDIGFVRRLESFPFGLQGRVVVEQALCLALPTKHRLARRRLVRCADLAGEEFVAPPIDVEWGPSGYLSAVAEEGGFTPRIRTRAVDFLTILTYVSAGLGIAVVSRSLTRIRMAGVAFRPISIARRAHLSVVCRRHERSPLVNDFLDVVIAHSKVEGPSLVRPVTADN